MYGNTPKTHITDLVHNFQYQDYGKTTLSASLCNCCTNIRRFRLCLPEKCHRTLNKALVKAGVIRCFTTSHCCLSLLSLSLQPVVVSQSHCSISPLSLSALTFTSNVGCLSLIHASLLFFYQWFSLCLIAASSTLILT